MHKLSDGGMLPTENLPPATEAGLNINSSTNIVPMGQHGVMGFVICNPFFFGSVHVKRKQLLQYLCVFLG